MYEVEKTVKKSHKIKNDTTLDEKFIDFRLRDSFKKYPSAEKLDLSLENPSNSLCFEPDRKPHYEFKPSKTPTKYYLSKPISTKTK